MRKRPLFIALIFGIAAVAIVLPVLLNEKRGAEIRAMLPPPPDTDGHNERTIGELRAAESAAREKPRSREAILVLAKRYHAYQFEGEAAAVYAAASRLAANDPEVAYLHAAAEETRHRWEDAAALYERTVALAPGFVDAWARLGLIRLRLGDLSRAYLAIEEAYRLDPLHPWAALGRAKLEDHGRRFDDVVAILIPALDQAPGFSEAHRLLGRAYRMLGEDDRAELHEERGEFGEAADDSLLAAVYALSVPAIIEGGDPARGRVLVEERCQQCHTPERIRSRTGEGPFWWGMTVRRMQRLAGKSLLTDDEAADAVAYLTSGSPPTPEPPDRIPEPAEP